MKGVVVPTVAEALVAASSYPDAGLRLVDRHENEEWSSWAEIHRRALRVAGALRRLGIQPGERVAQVFPTSWAFFDALFGTVLAGAVPVPLYPPFRLGRLEEYHSSTAKMVEAAGAGVILADARVRRLMGETVRRSRPRLGCQTLDEILPGSEPLSVEVSPHDLALIQFSSGTTLDPKPVALSHRAVMSQVLTLNGFWPNDEHIRHSGVSWLPLYHDMGLIGCVLPALERPGVLTLLPPEVFVSRPAIWLRTISRYRATISAAPNFAYGLCVNKIRDEEMEGVDLSTWRVALNGAETVSPRIMREFSERFAAWGLRQETLTPVYGLSEASLGVTFSDLDREFGSKSFRGDRLGFGDLVEEEESGTEIASVGRPLPEFEVQTCREYGSVCEEGEVGRIWVRGPSLMDEYLDRPDETREAMRNGWFDTGDLGFFYGGELYLTGREKDVVIVRGRNYAPDFLERSVNRIPGVRRGCTAVASTRVEAGATERVILFVEQDRRISVSDQQSLAERCRRKMVGWTGIEPQEVVVLAPGTLPRTSSGKMRRGEALRRYLAGSLEPPKPLSPWMLAREWMRSKLAFAARRLA